MSTWNGDAALQLVDELDACVAQLLPTGTASYGTSASAASTEKFLDVVTKLKTSLEQVLETETASQAPTSLQKQKQELEKELAEKDALISKTRQKLEAWQGTCTKLLRQHEDNMKLV